MCFLVVSTSGDRFVIQAQTEFHARRQVENTRRFDRFIEKALTIKTIQPIQKP